jgi:histone deacetylase complex regulatory component SIN3
LKNQSEEQLFLTEDERYEVDAYLNMTGSTTKAIKRLNQEYINKKAETGEEIDPEMYISMRDKFVGKTKIKWVKHIYNYTPSSSEYDPRFEFLNMTNPVVLPVIITRLEKLSENWDSVKKDLQK